MKKKNLIANIKYLEEIIDSYERQIDALQASNHDLKTKASAELWPLKNFLEKMAENIKKSANEYLAEPGTLEVKIIPIENEDGYSLAGYKAEVTAESFGYGDKDLAISLLRKENTELKDKLLLAVRR